MVPGGGVAAVKPDRAEEVDPGEVALVAGEVDYAEAGHRLGLQRGRRVLHGSNLAEELLGLGVVLKVPRDLGGERLHVGVARSGERLRRRDGLPGLLQLAEVELGAGEADERVNAVRRELEALLEELHRLLDLLRLVCGAAGVELGAPVVGFAAGDDRGGRCGRGKPKRG